MSNVELTHDVMRKLTAALGKVDSGCLRHFERINLVAEAFGWNGDALMHHLEKERANELSSYDVPSIEDGPQPGAIDLLVGLSYATRSAYVGVLAASMSEKLGLPVYGVDEAWQLFDRLLPVGIVMVGLETLDDWNLIVKLARTGNRVLVDVRSIANNLSKVLPLLGARPEELELVRSIVAVSERLNGGERAYSTAERLFPFKSE